MIFYNSITKQFQKVNENRIILKTFNSISFFKSFKSKKATKKQLIFMLAHFILEKAKISRKIKTKNQLATLETIASIYIFN